MYVHIHGRSTLSFPSLFPRDFAGGLAGKTHTTVAARGTARFPAQLNMAISVGGLAR